MKNISIPSTVEEYVSDLHEKVFPAEFLACNDFYRRLIGWVVDQHSPVIYQQTDESEYQNFSINFNWMALRDYSDSPLGPEEIMHTMYSLHEFSHMTHRLPVDIDSVTADEYADDFTGSEYRASNETEILIHERVPELRDIVLQGTKIAHDILRERKISFGYKELQLLRPLIVETDLLDGCFKSQEDRQILERFKYYAGNREWARERHAYLRKAIGFVARGLDRADCLTDEQYADYLPMYEPRLDQKIYEANMIRNARLGYVMCGLAMPNIKSFTDAQKAIKELEGHHATVN